MISIDLIDCDKLKLDASLLYTGLLPDNLLFESLIWQIQHIDQPPKVYGSNPDIGDLSF